MDVLRVGDWERLLADPGAPGVKSFALVVPRIRPPPVAVTVTAAQFRTKRHRVDFPSGGSAAVVRTIPTAASTGCPPRYVYRHVPSGVLHDTPPTVFGGTDWLERRMAPSGKLFCVRYAPGLAACGDARP